MENFVISGINLFEGGPLSIYYDCLDAIIAQKIHQKYHVTIFVHKKALFSAYEGCFEMIELPDSRRHYYKRLWYEYCYFAEYSRKNPVAVWLSLHDITPNVTADRIFTYCHNPSPFLKKDLSKIKFGYKYVAFSYFYKYLYRINMKKATAIIVQQDWMREAFKKMYPITNIIVARPSFEIAYDFRDESDRNPVPVFLFASFPRFFKNFELLFEAAARIREQKFEVWVTLDGTENHYAEYLYKKYRGVRQIRWLGLQKREALFKLYNKANCMIFPSQLETWGLPISEFKATKKAMLLADLPYAHEAVGSYDKAGFFDPYQADELAGLMLRYLKGELEFTQVTETPVNAPYAKNWDELIGIISGSCSGDARLMG